MSLMFVCQYCPAHCRHTFGQFKDLVKHYEAHHNKEGEQFRRLAETLSYSGSDSGCQRATDYLGYPSHCINCPFPKCVLDELGVGVARAKKRNRNEEIIQRFGPSESVRDLAVAFGVSLRTIQRALKKGKDG